MSSNNQSNSISTLPNREGGGRVPKPPASLFEILMQQVHRQVYDTPVSTTGEATVRVASHRERERGVMVVVEGTQRFVPHDLESESLCDPLNGEVAELLQ